MNPLHPLICGLWDGCGLWVQWDAQPSPETAFDLQLRFRRDDGAAPWGEWRDTVPPQGERSHWGVIPTWKEGWQAQARVRVHGAADGNAEWELAREVTFRECFALFEFASAKHPQHYVAGTIFHAQVDGAACAYQTREAIHINPGEPVRARMVSVGASGWHQLDAADHFFIRPGFGVTVRNVTASIEDTAETGRDFTVIVPKPGERLMLCVTPPGAF